MHKLNLDLSNETTFNSNFIRLSESWQLEFDEECTATCLHADEPPFEGFRFPVLKTSRIFMLEPSTTYKLGLSCSISSKINAFLSVHQINHRTKKVTNESLYQTKVGKEGGFLIFSVPPSTKLTTVIVVLSAETTPIGEEIIIKKLMCEKLDSIVTSTWRIVGDEEEIILDPGKT